MKPISIFPFLAACTLAQRLHIAEPTTSQSIQSSQNFTVDLQMDNSLSSMSQVSVIIAATACYDVCDTPDQWGPGTVLYNGSFSPQLDQSAPERGLHQGFQLTFPGLAWPEGETVFSVAHQFTVGVSEMPVFDFTTVHVNVQ